MTETEKRITGKVDWYNFDRGFGVIIGDDSKEYFVHYSNLSMLASLASGERVSFLARPRPLRKRGEEAYDVKRLSIPREKKVTSTPVNQKPIAQIPTSPRAWRAEDSNQTTQKSASQPFYPTPKLQSADSVQSTREAADVALQARLAQRRGTITKSPETFPLGSRVSHPKYGYGRVVLVSPEKLSIRLESDPYKVVDVLRSDLTLVIQEPTTPPIITPKITPVSGPSKIGAYIQKLRREVQETLTDEKIEAGFVYRFEEATEPVVPPQSLQINPLVANAFASEQITKFYSHQVQTRQYLLEGKHVVICTPTASGKTASYNPTILETLLQEPAARALYLFPLVALGVDQLDRLQRLNMAFPDNKQLIMGIYNSNVGYEEKSRTLRAQNRILVTTPDSLHYIFLPKPYPNWKQFYKNLRFVVLDEAHVYRGVFGANMANIIRRLLARCRREGNPRFPQVVLSTATVTNPAELAHQLTGLPEQDFALVQESGAPKPPRHFLVTRSDIHDLIDVCADLMSVITQDVRTRQQRPVRTIVFLRSINEVKASTDRLRHTLERSRQSNLVDYVADYYSEKSNKQDVFARLRKDEIRCLFTTTALMAGIDIGSLDVAIVKDFPGTVMDARQMFGRAGRAGEGAVIFIARRTDPFDQFYFERPDILFSGKTEDVIANPENPLLLAAHIKCAAQTGGSQYAREGPLMGQMVSLFGEMGQVLVNEYIKRQDFIVRNGSFWLPYGKPHDEEPLNNLRSMESSDYTLITTEGQELEKKRESNAYRDAHPEARIWCDGQRYRVERFDKESRQIICRIDSSTGIRTKGLQEFTLENIGEPITTELPIYPMMIRNGRVKISTIVNQYLMYQTSTTMQCRNRRCRHSTTDLNIKVCPRCGSPVRIRQAEKVTDECPIEGIDLSTSLTTRATWLELPLDLSAKFEREFWPRWTQTDLYTDDIAPNQRIIPSFEYGVHGITHALLKAFPEFVRCDQEELDGFHKLAPDATTGHIYIYDDFPGGLGLVEEFFQEPLPLFSTALDLVERCTCDDDEGCPVCLSYFGCNKFNAGLSKFATRYLLRVFLGKPVQNVLNDLAEYVNVVIPPSAIVTHAFSRSARVTTLFRSAMRSSS
jgi:DEAD/DEAH box helicase domain-containing protein